MKSIVDFSICERLSMLRLLTVGCLVSISPLAALAHEGHGKPGEGHTARHYLLEPVHLPLALLVAAIIVISAMLLLRYFKRARPVDSRVS